MQDHVRILGVLFIVMGGLGFLIALFFLVIFGLGLLGLAGAAAHQDPNAILAVPIIGVVGTFIAGFIAVCSLPTIVAGFGLLKYWPWARIVAIVLSALNLLSVPLGTALGIYGFWVLLNKETEPLFGVLPPPAPPAPQPPTP